MMHRRSFFRQLVPTAVGVALAPAVASLSELPITIEEVTCPRCLSLQRSPVRADFSSIDVYVRAVMTPQRIECNNPECGWTAMVTFGRRIH